ncbi:hypothetical protein VTN49DRAFT_5978 [Thermomyces lanuginosus]|uniref:uncharacterized protein n=1 Tax=Thermomyces lanuginosus TaxID=5541 RepID=UPI003742C7D3
MANLDDELLALAGGDSSEEESSPRSPAKSKSPSPSKQRSPEPPSRMARKGTAKVIKRPKRAKKEESDEEEGELSSAESDNSLNSAPMSESDSDEVAPDVEDEGPIFPYEKLYYSAQDKEEIMALPEIKREEILSERAAQVDRHNQDLALRRLLASREREQARAEQRAKRKASATDLEEGQRKSTRQKTTLGGRKVGETSGAIEAYKRQREQKGKRDEQRRREADARRARQRSPSHEESAYSDGEAEEESEVEEEKKERSPPKDDPPAGLKDIQRVRVGRSNFAMVCFYPTFEKSITGCFTRVNIGPNRETGQNEYRVCIIKKFTTGKPYAIQGANGRTFVTDQYAVVAHGKAEREFPFIACSDSPFTEAEFARWRQTMVVEGCKLPTKSQLAAKVVDINNLINYQFTPEELNEKLRKQGAMSSKQHIWKRLELEKAIKEATAAGDYEEVDRLQAELAAHNAPKLAFGTTLNRPRQEKDEQQERLAEINLRNQKLNAENARRAQMEERKLQRKNAAAIARGEASIDPFARVRTVAKTHHDVMGTNKPKVNHNPPASGTVSPAPASESSKMNSPRRSETPSSQRTKGISVIRPRNADENIAALDLDIDIEV